MPSKQTSLGRIYEALGIPDWEEMFPKAICEKCQLVPVCKESCAALTTIGGLAVRFSVEGRTGAQIFATEIRNVLKKVL